ncbi:hypothetical protein EX30DRAFT_340544 [Ascodesmis nigricans]|uniref:DUF7923 domain-containing protein n=1 Tax=Ascodesmis nigricans TaxID=341454 RepID=A0A4S2MYL7_9PEZI|nr:hypothetical protein EX30DRAFT_340544 [Ascodesmis nigricans]
MDFRSLSPQKGLIKLQNLNDGLYEWISNLVERNQQLEEDTIDLKQARDVAHRYRAENDRLKRRLEAIPSRSEPNGTNAPFTPGNDDKGNYVVVLIDGDALPFTDYLLSRGYDGGKQAADRLLAATFVIAKRELPNVRFTTRMTIYNNVTKTADELIKSNIISNAEDYRAFTHGFTRQKTLGNIVDVGLSDDAADKKVRDEIRQWHFDSPLCRLILLGASHDNGWAHTFNFLENCSDTTLLKKVILFDGANRASEYQNRVFQRESIPGIFNAHKLGNSFRSSPIATVRPQNRRKSSTHSNNNNKHNSWMPKKSEPSSTTINTDGDVGDLFGWGPPKNPNAEADDWWGQNSWESNSGPLENNDTSIPAWRAKTGGRSKPQRAVMPRTKTFFDGRPSQEAFRKIKRLFPGPCNMYYLQGHCTIAAKNECSYSHDYILSAEEVEALKLVVLAKGTPCRFDKKCTKRDVCFRAHTDDWIDEEGVAEEKDQATGSDEKDRATDTGRQEKENDEDVPYEMLVL